MLQPIHGIPNILKDRWRDQEGTATVEFVIIFPVFMLLLALIADASLIFFGQASALRAVQDANRSFSVGRYTTETETENGIVAALLQITPNAVATSTASNGSILSTVTFPAGDLASLGLISQLTNFSLSVTSEHLVEY